LWQRARLFPAETLKPTLPSKVDTCVAKC
jgi:hypothetical protein